MGLAFSVPKGIKVPSSLVNIFKELKDDLGCSIPSHGNLERWVVQVKFITLHNCLLLMFFSWSNWLSLICHAHGFLHLLVLFLFHHGIIFFNCIYGGILLFWCFPLFMFLVSIYTCYAYKSFYSRASLRTAIFMLSSFEKSRNSTLRCILLFLKKTRH